MKSLTYEGPGHVLVLPSGREVAVGETADVTNDDVDAAQAMSNVNVTVHEPEADDGEGHPEQEEE